MRVVLLIAAFGLMGCSSIRDAEDSIITFSEKDLAAAITDADNHKDAVASYCYRGILEVLTEIPDRIETIGAFTAFQRVRDIHAFNMKMQTALETHCAPILLQLVRAIRKLS